ncbi:MAG: HPP family protein [Candidatus Kuenenia stuttgartiensis]|nr:HPP family protein [Planctomycetia bacterium]MBZ0191816.1 HPP family protein [Candidatus Kuenenia stuttgartiensis]MCF6152034.1 HPP family protein [Candidatus Kuenenia stuttgartiensis]MCL4725942.1 HPP family protein [Candidatus Kuenenia stuttgartiensis]TVM02236.1 MAG: HPP family protein [Candidatus Kuenenia stuttgartiensis]
MFGAIKGIEITSWLAFSSGFSMLLGPFGASAVLIYEAYKAPLAQPRNVIMMHFAGACSWCVIYDLFGTNWY